LLINDRIQVANAAATYQTKAVERAALANTNAYISAQATRITLVNTNLLATNTAIRALAAAKLSVANAVAVYTTKSNPTTSGIFAHTGRATISTNLTVSGNTIIGACNYIQSFFATASMAHNSNFQNIGGTGWVRFGTGAAAAVRVGSDGFSVFTTPTGDAGSISSVPARLLIDVDGDVGIGTVTPAAKLNVVDSSTQDAVRITQTGTGNALVVEDEANPDASPFVVNPSGVIGIGDSSPGSIVSAGMSLKSSVAFCPTISIWNTTNDGSFTQINTRKDRNGAIVQNGDTIFSLRTSGYDGAAYRPLGDISFNVDGTPGLSDMPGRITFSTTADGGSTATERMRITSAGRVGIGNTAPTHKLSVNGTTFLQANTTVSGTMTASGIVSGLELVSTNANGDEGGEIKLTKPPNGTLSGGVTIDAFQNKIRFFEQGGSARGAYINLADCVGGVGTNLLAGGGASSNGFSGILVGSNVVVADSSSDRLTFVAGSGISIAANPTTDTITFSSTASAAFDYGTAYALRSISF
jgi:hypothetical protein